MVILNFSKFIRQVVLILHIFVVLPRLLWADGTVFTATEYPVETSGPSQQAFIIYTDSSEVLILQSEFGGKGDRFLWLVPVPNFPQIDTVYSNIFNFLEIITVPSVMTSTFLIGPGILILVLLATFPLFIRRSIKTWLHRLILCTLIIVFILLTIGIHFVPMGPKDTKVTTPMAIPGVKIYETKSVGLYDVNVLSINDPEIFVDWMYSHNYYLPDRALPIIEDYVKRNWYFIVAQISSDIHIDNQIGKIPPLKITFTSGEPIYPLKITSLSTTNTDILLYILGKNLFKSKNFNIEKAMSIDSLYLKTLVKRCQLSIDRDHYILTKLYAQFTPSEMDEDITFHSDKSRKINTIVYTEQARKYILLLFVICILVGYMGSTLTIEFRKKLILICYIVLVMLLSRFWILFKSSRYHYREIYGWKRSPAASAEVKANMYILQQSLEEFANITGGYYPANLSTTATQIAQQISLESKENISLTGTSDYENIFAGEIGIDHKAILPHDITNPFFSKESPGPVFTTSFVDPPSWSIPGVVFYVPLEVNGNIAKGYKIYGAGKDGLLSLVFSSEDKNE